LPANAVGQTNASAKSVENQLEPLRQLILDNRLAEAERLVRSVLPTPEAEPKQTGGFLNVSAYDLVWGMIANRYLANNDYASAERIASERLKLAQSAAGTDPYHIQMFTFLLANTFLTQGNYAQAMPLYQRLVRADVQNDLSADFQVKTSVGMTEVLMAQGRAAQAERFLKPMIFAEGADPARPAAFHEELFNTYAVALMEAGQSAAADQIVAQIGRESSRPAGLDQQDRDLLRARMLRTRGSFTEAESIYQKWIKHWDDRPPASGSIQRELAEPRLKPLQEYTHFLTLRRRSLEAQAARARLRMLEREYNVTF
jgi:tetratricopeptide (TPR) repeat protein